MARTRAPLAVALLLVLGTVTGFALALVVGEYPAGSGAAAPVAAQSPSLPVDPVPELLPDPTTPPLAPGVELERTSVGSGDFRMTLPVPRGWDSFANSLNEWQWQPPDQPDFGYALRVEQVLSNRRSITWTLENRIGELNEDEENVEILERTANSLHFSYVRSNHLRHAYLLWLDLSGSDNAQVEIGISGRKVDDAGMADLVRRIGARIRLG